MLFYSYDDLICFKYNKRENISPNLPENYNDNNINTDTNTTTKTKKFII